MIKRKGVGHRLVPLTKEVEEFVIKGKDESNKTQYVKGIRIMFDCFKYLAPFLSPGLVILGISYPPYFELVDCY